MSALARRVAEDLLILVDSEDREIGQRAKTECHLGDGILHRAFSVFLFNERGEVLIQQRAPGKMLWAGYWSNSCCSHPRPGETTEAAAGRRVLEELALPFGSVGSENELCHVFAGYVSGDPRADASEIAAWRWVDPAALSTEIAADHNRFSPWMQLEWTRIISEYLPAIRADLQREQANRA
jgi:isopentenyl-diphosphate Delta-isomerase